MPLQIVLTHAGSCIFKFLLKTSGFFWIVAKNIKNKLQKSPQAPLSLLGLLEIIAAPVQSTSGGGKMRKDQGRVPFLDAIASAF